MNKKIKLIVGISALACVLPKPLARTPHSVLNTHASNIGRFTNRQKSV